jgi:gluconokinase
MKNQEHKYNRLVPMKSSKQGAPPVRWVVMGVSGCGKSIVGALLAQALDAPFIEGDAFHPAANVARMAAGIALTDADRAGWLDALAVPLAQAAAAGAPLVLACSALKRRYRDRLRRADPALRFAHLDGPPDLLAARMAARPGHFMPVSLLESQLHDLEALASDEAGLRLDLRQPPAALVAAIVAVTP